MLGSLHRPDPQALGHPGFLPKRRLVQRDHQLLPGPPEAGQGLRRRSALGPGHQESGFVSGNRKGAARDSRT